MTGLDVPRRDGGKRLEQKKYETEDCPPKCVQGWTKITFPGTQYWGPKILLEHGWENVADKFRQKW